MLLHIVKITDGKAGHMAISDGLIEAVKKNYSIEVTEISITIRAKFLLWILKVILKYNLLATRLVANELFIRLFYKNYRELDNKKIDLIVSAGGDTIFLNIWMSRMLNVKNIFCGTPRSIRPSYFYLIVSVIEIAAKNSIKLDSFPAKIGSSDIGEKIEKFCNEKHIDKHETFFVLLIGGDTSAYTYTKNDYINLVNNFMSIVKKYNAKALITTSRRTGNKYENLLKELLLSFSDDIAYSVYFGQKPEKVVALYLELASAVFVTEESGSMISESLFAKKPVILLYPEMIKEDRRYKTFLNDLCAQKRVARISINSELSDLDIDKFEFNFIDKLPTDELAEKIQPYIKDIAL